MAEYLGGGDSPDLEVVWSHEQIGNTSTHHSNNPLIEVFWLILGCTSNQCSVNHAVNALNLVLRWQHRDVVLEWVWNPEVLASYIRNALVGVPIILLRQRLVDTIIEVFVVREDNVATNIVELLKELATSTRN